MGYLGWVVGALVLTVLAPKAATRIYRHGRQRLDRGTTGEPGPAQEPSR